MTARLTRAAISDAVTPLGWRLHSGAVYTVIPVTSLRNAALAAGALATVPGGEDHLRLDLRADAVLARVATPETEWVSPPDLDLVAALTAEVTRLGLTTQPLTGKRPAQVIEIGIDALDPDAIRPFWRAVLAYVPDPDNPADLIDPYGQGPMVWFQQMDAPRPAAQPHPLRCRGPRRPTPRPVGCGGRCRWPGGRGHLRSGVLGAG